MSLIATKDFKSHIEVHVKPTDFRSLPRFCVRHFSDELICVLQYAINCSYKSDRW